MRLNISPRFLRSILTAFLLPMSISAAFANVTNPSFEIDASGAQIITGWSESGSNPTASFISSSSPAKSGTRYLGHWATSSFSVFTYQNKTGLLNGAYTLKAWIKRRGTFATAQMEASGFGGSTRTVSLPPTTVWTQIAISGIIVTNGSCTFGFRSVGSADAAVCVDLVEFAPEPPGVFYKRPITGIGLNCADGSSDSGIYKMPDLALLTWAKSLGVNVLRVSFKWERLQPALYDSFYVNSTTQANLQAMKNLMTQCESLGINVVWNMHNYGLRYNDYNNRIGTTIPVAAFADFWGKFAAEFKDYPCVAMYGLMNEPYRNGISHATWKNACQEAVNAIRAQDPRTPIAVPGQGSTAWDWCSGWWDATGGLQVSNADMTQITGNYIAFEAHQYPDWNSKGIFEDADPWQALWDNLPWIREPDRRQDILMICCKGSTATSQSFFNWLQTNNRRGFIGETGIPSGCMKKGTGIWAPHSKHRAEWREAVRRLCDHGINNGIPIFLWTSGVHYDTNDLVISHLAPWSNGQPTDPVQQMIKTLLANKPLIQ